MTPCLLCGGDMDHPDHWQRCAEAAKAEHYADGNITATTGEALGLLEQTRRHQIDLARETARRLAVKGTRLTTFDVRNEMIRTGEYDRQIPDHWLGCVFRPRREWIWTGEWFTPPVNGELSYAHAPRPLKVWRWAYANADVA